MSKKPLTLCPDCKVPLHFEMLGGVLLAKREDGYHARCPKCKGHYRLRVVIDTALGARRARPKGAVRPRNEDNGAKRTPKRTGRKATPKRKNAPKNFFTPLRD